MVRHRPKARVLAQPPGIYVHERPVQTPWKAVSRMLWQAERDLGFRGFAVQVEYPYIPNGLSRNCEVGVPVGIRLGGMQPFTRFEAHRREETDSFRDLLARDVDGQNILVWQEAQFHAVCIVSDRYFQHLRNTFAPC